MNVAAQTDMKTITAGERNDTSRQRLRAGIFVPPFHPLDEDPTLCLERDFELLQHLDRLGYEEAWIGEHHSAGFEIVASPELFAATALERTSRIRIGTGVISLSYHNPLTTAGRIAQLDHQSRGRAMFGFGPGLLNSDAQMMAIDAHTQRDRMGESLDVIVRLLNGEVVSAKTDWFELRDARLQLQPYRGVRPELAVASTLTPNGAKLAGKYGMSMLCISAASPQGYDVLDLNWQAACKSAVAHGNVMDRSGLRLMSPFHVAETRQQAIDDLQWGFEKFCAYQRQVNINGPAGIGLGPIDEMIANKTAVIGTPDDAVEQLERFWQKTGGFGCIMVLAHSWANPEATKKSFDLLARHALPKFAARNSWREASYDWVGDNLEAFSSASRAAMEATLAKHRKLDAEGDS